MPSKGHFLHLYTFCFSSFSFVLTSFLFMIKTRWEKNSIHFQTKLISQHYKCVCVYEILTRLVFFLKWRLKFWRIRVQLTHTPFSFHNTFFCRFFMIIALRTLIYIHGDNKHAYWRFYFFFLSSRFCSNYIEANKGNHHHYHYQY